MAEDLLPCPFCGGAAELTWACLVRDTYWWVICPNAECVVRCSGFQSLSKSDAIAAWNRRAALPRADRAEIVEECAAWAEQFGCRYSAGALKQQAAFDIAKGLRSLKAKEPSASDAGEDLAHSRAAPESNL